MTRLLPIAGALLLAATTLSAASVTGTVGFVTKRGQNPVKEETLLWLEPASGTKVKRPPVTAQMTTRGKALLPHVMAIPVGSTVNFPNEDPISHNLFSLTSGNQFDLGLYRAGAGKSHTFATPGVVNVYCNVHPQMSAVIHILSSPYFTFADPKGSFAFTDVPAGRYDLVAWNELGSTSRTTIDVAAATPAQNLTIDCRGFRGGAHTDKNGKAYAPPRSREY